MIEVQDGNRDSEQDTDSELDVEDPSTQGIADESKGSVFIGKDEQFILNNIKPPSIRTKSHNLVLKVPSSVGDANNANLIWNVLLILLGT